METPKKIAFHTLGCKLNFSETSSIARIFENKGFEKVDFSSPADIYVINTCSVTVNADKECKTIVRSALKLSPDAFIVVIGCYAQLKPNEIASIEGVDLVLGASEKFRLAEYISDLSKKTKTEVYSCEIEQADFFVDAYSFGDRTRVFLKVQDGCDYTCSFCTIPLARGKSRSDSIQNAVKNANEIAGKGVKEIVLTGVNLGDFGKQGDKKNEEDFLSLIKELDNVQGIDRFRVSSIEPNLLKDEVIEFVSTSQKFVPHFHIPLQSGSDKILKAMRRRYLTKLYTERVKKIRTLMPDCCIGVDVITGFPGETEQDFLETYNYLNNLDISYLHVFTYSERDNTDALNIEQVIPLNIRKQRNKMLRILSVKKSRSFYEKFKGSKQQVLFEGENKDGFMHGFSENYIKVKHAFDASLINEIVNVNLLEIDSDGSYTSELFSGNSIRN
ncbi:MAG: tRNA (N(6)-L-threonylcarbamoyladenosine(37)-C(2))-methylthiotransferase MtaB [Bacteroidetes bacterium]|nr:tRNA (N(6)-L-threonylcarbamoyladenosine(37)-C(2))-methylthiotransferase MtaB [Bacteroidota bacterium]HET6243403.1 tRNA (N(6)-L-threonylcarbamoyladenosine(37)-C(2))-methylthiotransferase MtaB [Bacteroidia bacterium]